ncbi:MAG: 3-hydroxyacyl-CoA dehydrogenase NAD-binding domain-containing protein [Cellvibrionaceae bacterium]
MSVVNYELQGDVGVIKINNPPVNALSQSLRQGLTEALASAQADASKAVLVICEGRTFIAGADITEFGKPPQEPSLPAVLDAIENSKKPVIAAIHGTALGGGLEVALACHYRCALPSAKVGLPEVKLGILPGAGGTQRAPRLMGVEAALNLITSGNPISAKKAQASGLVDKVVDGDDLLVAGLAYANELVASGAPLKRVRDIKIDPASVPAGFFEAARKKLAKRARGQIAQDRIVSCIEAAVNLPMDEGLAKERELFAELVSSPQSAAMRHAFFAEREAAKVKGLAKDTPVRDIKSIAIIGGGTMGGGIAMNFMNVGIPVKMVEINEEALQRGFSIIEKNYKITASKGKMTEEQVTQCMSLLSGTTNYDDLGEVDLVIEAVFENIGIKKEVFAKLDAACKPGCILASNTSYQDIDEIATATKRPEDVVGMHFFSPANVMKLLENVRGEKTADDVVATVMKLAKKINKVPVLARVCYGFIGNRMLKNYGREAQLCLVEGATPKQIDDALEGFGMAMGPIAMGDLAGIDIGYKAREGLTDEQKGDPKAYLVADTLCEAGRLGQKTGKGYYKYDPETRARLEDPEAQAIIEKVAADLGVERRDVPSEEIVERCIYGLVNEGARVLAEGIAQRPSDIDVVYLFGYAFPAAKGGPMFYADQVGLKKVYDRICDFNKANPNGTWEPAPLLKELALAGKSFADWAKENS